ncbi:class I SAM-dependent methyltransferase [Robertkochia marina]|uniref:Class I SAM-dependent methyltransferase n=1 Tax=Robertkochia marina TaxID=1227945 RepID=A0A4S3M0Q0_9FLAO|nr:class I SAM-dependent methyltransferase [Robertkochia marina]THD66523.1 class I SAM-dependent methyltransferase [Robertkochia marina]TRZ45636.1 class I SAM-dependent methyltransferase [Robertkochia marina]
MSRSSFILSLCLLFSGFVLHAQVEPSAAEYTFKEGSYGGIGKWFMGREIAAVMSYRGMDWLERNSRPKEENTITLIANLDLQPGDVVADIGAGSGYHVFKMAPMVSKGQIYAVDIQPEMLAAIRTKMETERSTNVIPVEGDIQSVNLPENSINKVLMVDVYHEFEFPLEMMASVKKALKPDGRVYLIEYRGEDPNVAIKKLHKMTLDQAVKEMNAAGFQLVKNIDNLPLQHCMIFEKTE